MDGKKLLTVEEVAARLKISPKTILNGTSRKSKRPFYIRAVHLGRSVRFREEDVDRFIEGL